MKELLTINEFAAVIKVSPKLAYGMARCELFQQLKISVDVSIKRPDRKHRLWRFDLDRYYDALEKGAI